MCWFVTVALPDVDARAFERTERVRRQLHLSPAGVDGAPAGFFGQLVTRGGCSCDLLPSTPPDLEAELEKEAKRLRRKQFSEAKVSRVLEAMRERLSRPIPPREGWSDFKGFLGDLLANVSEVLIHTEFRENSGYDSLHAERSPEPMALDDVQRQGMPENVWVRLVGSEHKSR
ncbi:MAG: hypothetical protein R3F12_05105 [Lysobacteraceae bacterium]